MEAKDLIVNIISSKVLAMTKEECLKEFRVGLNAPIDALIIKRPSFFDGLDEYIYMPIDNGMLLKIDSAILKSKGIEEKEAWTTAEKNTVADVKIESLESVMGIPVTDETEPKIFMISNSNRRRGAGAAIAKGEIKKFASEHGAKNVMFLPSSIHEMLLLLDLEVEVDKAVKMVKEINASVVSPEDRLIDTAYLYDVNDL